MMSLALSACGHGAPERYGRGVEDYATPPAGDVTVGIRSFFVSRPARGLSAIPDGGIGIVLDGGVEINVCTKATRQFRRIAVVHESPKLLAEGVSTPGIKAWRDTAVLVTLTATGDTLIVLPRDIKVGSGNREKFQRIVIPQCQAALDSLNDLRLLPDGSPVTDGAP